ncbi:YopX family protein [Bacillus toyonensis]|uniref:YopX family protein n=1 Tax=Bacillus toyonensis TaxID=155322 RepID=UPI000BECE15E|nr:YopX family protein [Bacillus toyonensis]PDY91457.1 hypothetical protein CON67_10315 [Bacillus toyonensis]
MREIKYKAYVKELNLVLPVLSIQFDFKKVEVPATYSKHIDTEYFNFEQVELIQYTGLKDSKGNEIYEGDILESISGTVGNPEAKVQSIYEVVLDDRNSYSFGTRRKGRTHISSPIYRSATKYYKVIGNIYENPELLKGGN